MSCIDFKTSKKGYNLSLSLFEPHAHALAHNDFTHHEGPEKPPAKGPQQLEILRASVVKVT